MARGVAAICLLALVFCQATAVRNIFQTGACATVYDPVCGEDGMTYSNDCVAKEAGVDWICIGECVCPVPLLTSDSTSTFCKTSSEAVLELVGSGSGSARSSSFCKAEAEAQSSIQEFVSNYVDQVFNDASSGCTVNSASLVANATALAAAKVITTVNAEVNIDGTGEACASGFATGDAVATAIVDITIKIYLNLVEEKFEKEVYEDVKKALSGGEGKAVGRAVAAVISSAWAKASQGVCTTNGFAKGADESFAESINQATAFLWAEVVLTLCESVGADTKELKEWRMELSESTSQVSGDITFQQVVNKASGDAIADGGEIPACTGAKGTICCSTSQTGRDKCTCGANCALSSESAKIWVDDDTGERCLCP